MIPGLVQELDENVDENLELSCKLIKKVATPLPNFYINPPPPFQVYPPFLAKNFVPPKWRNFWKVLPPTPFIKGVGVPTIYIDETWQLYLT